MGTLSMVNLGNNIIYAKFNGGSGTVDEITRSTQKITDAYTPIDTIGSFRIPVISETGKIGFVMINVDKTIDYLLPAYCYGSIVYPKK